MKRGIVLLVTLAVVAAACGGSDDAEGSGPEPDVTASQPESDATSGGDDTSTGTSEADEESDEETSDSEGSGPSTATVTFGDETYSFSTEGALVAQCQTDLFGIFSAQLPMVDDSGNQAEGFVSIVALLEGTDPAVVEQVNAVEVDIADEKWVADESSEYYGQVEGFEAGMSQVDSVDVDGRTVRGSATFVRLNSLFAGEIETMTGTFEATCGEERLS